MNFDNIQSPLPARKSSLGDLGDINNNPIPPAGQNINNENQNLTPPVNPPTPPITPPKGNNFNIKKFLPWIGIVVVVLLIIFVVFKVLIPKLSNKPSGNVTLNYWGLWEDSAVLQGLIDEYEANNPGVKINYIHNERTNYRTRLAGRLGKTGSGDGADSANEAPDIFRIHSSWVPMFRTNLANVPNDVASSTQLDNDFYDAYKKDLKQGSSYVGIPLMYDQLALFYNKEILDAAQKTPPRTWWGLRDSAKQLTVKDANGNIKVAGVALGTAENVDHWSDILGLMMKQNGVDLLATDKANETKLKGILTFYTLFNTQDRVWDESLADSTTQFANGKLAFYFGPSWRVFNLEDMNKNLKFEVVGVPQLPTLEGLDDRLVETGEIDGKLTDSQWSTYWFEGVNNKSKNQKEAWKFLQFLSTKESLEKFYTTASQIRSFGELYPRKSMNAKLLSGTKTKAFVTGADNGSSWYLSSRTFDEGLNDDLSKYFGDAINSMLHDNISVDDAYVPLKNGITQQMTKFNIKSGKVGE